MNVPICPKHRTNALGQDEINKEMGNGEPTEFLHLLNPKNYKYLPPQYTNAIRSAGRRTAASDHVN
jgi:hypothetical protein